MNEEQTEQTWDEKLLTFMKRIGATVFWLPLFVWLLLLIWDKDNFAGDIHVTLKLAMTGLLAWMLAYLAETTLVAPAVKPPKKEETPSGYAYPLGRTRVTLNYIILFTVVFLALTILGLSQQFNSATIEAREGFKWLSIFTRGNREVLLVAVAAGLGSSLATILAFIRHAIYDEDFKDSFVPWYLLRPLMGALLGVIFYFLIKGGMLALANDSGGDNGQSLDPYSLAGMATLVGFFSRQAIDKLKDIFDAMFSSTDDKVAVSNAEARKAELAARNATYEVLKTEIAADPDPAKLTTLETVWKRVVDEEWTIGSGDETTLMATLKDKLKGKMIDAEINTLGF